MTGKTATLSRRAALIGAGLLPALPAIARFTPAAAKAPLLDGARPTHYRYKLGSFEITTINDGAVHVDGPHPIFGADQSADDVKALAEANFLPADKLEISFAPVMVNTGNELIIFDSGNGAGRRPNAGRAAEAIRAAGYTPDQVDVVVLTHYHPDHIGGLMEDGEPLFPNARYVAAAAEHDFWTHADRMSGPTEAPAKVVEANVKPLAEKATFVKDGDDVVSGIRALAAGGHTPGHTAFHIESDGKRLLLGGDFCNHPVVSLQRPDWQVRFDMDKEAAVASRVRLLDMIAADRIPFTSYHMPFPSVGFVEKSDQGYRYVPASYQLNL